MWRSAVSGPHCPTFYEKWSIHSMCVQTSKFSNIWSQIKHISIHFCAGRGSETQLQKREIKPINRQIGIFTHLKLCLADAIHNFK